MVTKTPPAPILATEISVIVPDPWQAATALRGIGFTHCWVPSGERYRLNRGEETVRLLDDGAWTAVVVMGTMETVALLNGLPAVTEGLPMLN